jgi:serine/threonine-protein kinase RsbW
MQKKEISIPSIYERVSEACFSLRDFCFHNSVEKKICSELELCLTEALNNVIKHAYKEDFLQKIDLAYSFDSNQLKIEIEDFGLPRTNFKEPVLNYNPSDVDTLPEGGMGLYIIKNLMDDVIYSRIEGKNRFIMKKIL